VDTFCTLTRTESSTNFCIVSFRPRVVGFILRSSFVRHSFVVRSSFVCRSLFVCSFVRLLVRSFVCSFACSFASLRRVSRIMVRRRSSSPCSLPCFTGGVEERRGCRLCQRTVSHSKVQQNNQQSVDLVGLLDSCFTGSTTRIKTRTQTDFQSDAWSCMNAADNKKRGHDGMVSGRAQPARTVEDKNWCDHFIEENPKSECVCEATFCPLKKSIGARIWRHGRRSCRKTMRRRCRAKTISFT